MNSICKGGPFDGYIGSMQDGNNWVSISFGEGINYSKTDKTEDGCIVFEFENGGEVK